MAAPLWRRWTLATAAGELVGFTAPAVAGAISTRLAPAAAYGLLLTAGLIEGYVLGYAQAWAAGPVLPRLSRPAFALATAAAAALGYGIGLLPATVVDRLSSWPPAVLAAAAAAGGLVLLASIGTAQWLVLRRYRYGSPWWIASTAGAWLAALLVFVAVTTPLWRPGQPLAVTAVIGVLGGAAMALVAAALTGLAATRLLVPARPPADPVLGGSPIDGRLERSRAGLLGSSEGS